MRVARPARYGDPTARPQRLALSVLRILIGTYFLAAAAGLLMDSSRADWLVHYMTHEQAIALSAVFLSVSALGMITGLATRPAAVLLALYVLTSNLATRNGAASPEALTAFWSDMILMGAVLMFAIVGANGRARPWSRRRVAPRRITPEVVFRRAQPEVDRPASEITPVREAIRSGAPAGPILVVNHSKIVDEDGDDADSKDDGKGLGANAVA